MANAFLENSLEIPKNVKPRFIMESNNSTPRYIPGRNENVHPFKIVRVFIAVLFI